MENNLIEIKINNKSFGQYKGRSFFITQSLKNKLEDKKLKDGKTSYDYLIQFGPLGGKYLLEIIGESLNKDFKLILSDTTDQLKDTEVIINYPEFKKLLQRKFWPLRRQNGIEGTRMYLNEVSPAKFSIPEVNLPIKGAEQMIQSLPKVIKTEKQGNAVLEQIAILLREHGKTPKDLKKIFASGALKEIQAASNQSFFKQKLEEFHERLEGKYSETKGKNSWQSWIYENTWMFGLNYRAPIEKQRVGFRSIPDYLFPSVDGFLDILEIKLPSEDAIQEDSSHRGAFLWGPVTSAAIGQVVNYLSEIELHQLELKQIIEREYRGLKISTIKPRAIILIGNTNSWLEEKKEAFRKLNYSLHGIEVLTYDHLQSRAEILLEIYNKRI